MTQWCEGIRPDDLVQGGFPFGLFFGGWGTVQRVARIGAALFPLGVAESEKHLEFIQRLQPRVFSGTPSSCMHLITVAQKLGITTRDSSVEVLLVGDAPGGSLPGSRTILEEACAATLIAAGPNTERYPFPNPVGSPQTD